LAFQILDSIIGITVATTIVIGTELTIKWNNIASVQSCNSAGQLIPLFLGLAAFLRVVYKAATTKKGFSDIASQQNQATSFHNTYSAPAPERFNAMYGCGYPSDRGGRL
jgi:hypothetical protein